MTQSTVTHAPVPTLAEYLAAARPLNPDYSDEAIAQEYVKRYGPSTPTTPARIPTFEQYLAAAKPLNPDYSDEDIKSIWQQTYGIQGAREAEPTGSGAMRGATVAARQLPQLAYGLEAGVGAAGEAAFGEGGISTKIKEHGLAGYERKSQEIAAISKDTDSFTVAYDRAKDGDFGALADWLQFGLGYAGLQGVQMLATAGVGAVAGRLTLQPLARIAASKMVSKEAARLAATETGKAMVADEVRRQAVKNVAARIGETAALAATATGMEGGEIFGGLTEQAEREGRTPTGAELGKALGASLAAGALEFAGDKFGLDLVLGRSALGRVAASTPGMKGLLVRGAVRAGVDMPVEAATEYAQTLTEAVGQGKDPLSSEVTREAIDSAALGAVGGAAVGGVSGVVTPPDPIRQILTSPSIDQAVDQSAATLDMKAEVTPESLDRAITAQNRPESPTASPAAQAIEQLPIAIPGQELAAAAPLSERKPAISVPEAPGAQETPTVQLSPEPPTGRKPIHSRTVDEIHALADVKGIPWDDDEAFMDFTESITGKRALDDLVGPERNRLYAALERRQPLAQPGTSEDTTQPAAPRLRFEGIQQGAKGIGEFELWTLQGDYPGLTKDSTYSRQTLEQAGITVPPAPTTPSQPSPSPIQATAAAPLEPKPTEALASGAVLHPAVQAYIESQPKALHFYFTQKAQGFQPEALMEFGGKPVPVKVQEWLDKTTALIETPSREVHVIRELAEKLMPLPGKSAMPVYREAEPAAKEPAVVQPRQTLPQEQSENLLARAEVASELVATDHPTKPSLVEALRAQGGVQDQGGELSYMHADADRKAFQRNLINPKGLTLDGAAEWAVEHGYLEERNINDLLAAIDRELRASPAKRSLAARLKMRKDTVLKALEKIKQDKGVDVGPTVEKVKAAILADRDLDAIVGEFPEVGTMLREQMALYGEEPEQTAIAQEVQAETPERQELTIADLNALPRVQRMRASMAKGFKWGDQSTGMDMARQMERSLRSQRAEWVLRWNNGLNLPLIKTFFNEAGIPSVTGWSQKGIRAALEDWQGRARKEAIPATQKPEPARLVKEPWEMTREEWLDQPARDLPPIIGGKARERIALARHRAAVERALREGKPVPAEVLAEYPDLPQTLLREPEEPYTPGMAPARGPGETPPAKTPQPGAGSAHQNIPIPKIKFDLTDYSPRSNSRYVDAVATFPDGSDYSYHIRISDHSLDYQNRSAVSADIFIGVGDRSQFQSYDEPDMIVFDWREARTALREAVEERAREDWKSTHRNPLPAAYWTIHTKYHRPINALLKRASEVDREILQSILDDLRAGRQLDESSERNWPGEARVAKEIFPRYAALLHERDEQLAQSWTPEEREHLRRFEEAEAIKQRRLKELREQELAAEKSRKQWQETVKREIDRRSGGILTQARELKREMVAFLQRVKRETRKDVKGVPFGGWQRTREYLHESLKHEEVEPFKFDKKDRTVLNAISPYFPEFRRITNAQRKIDLELRRIRADVIRDVPPPTSNLPNLSGPQPGGPTPPSQTSPASTIAQALRQAADAIEQAGQPKEEAPVPTAESAEPAPPTDFTVHQPSPRYGEPAPIFYSQAQRVLEQKMPNKALAAQVRNILSPANGVKPDELTWSGLDEFLKTKPIFTKQEVLDYLKANQVNIREVTYTDLSPNKQARLRYLQTNEIILDDAQRTELNSLEEQAGIAGTGRLASERQTKFSSYQLPGGTNYRELLLTLPPSKPTDAEIEQIDRLIDERERLVPEHAELTKAMHEMHMFEPRAAAAKTTYARLDAINEEMERLDDEIEAIRNRHSVFTGGHFDVPNVLAHVRMNDRTGPNGEKILFLEEIQSDWHQKGRREGYKEEPKFTKEEQELRRLNAITSRELTLEHITRARELQAKVGVSLQEKVNRANRGVLNAPFKKTWHELALRRMLRYASEHGYDTLAWTTGEQQAERYDLSKHVDRILYSENGKLAAYKDGKPVITQIEVPPERLADFIGKAAADNMLAAQPKRDAVGRLYRELSGLDLKVGGEGMKGFYDEIIPAYLHKYTKRWGATVNELNLDIGAEERKKYADGPQHRIEQVHALDITPQMRDSVLTDGQILFQRQAAYPVRPGESADDARQLALFAIGDLDRAAEGVSTAGGTLVPKGAGREAGGIRTLGLGFTPELIKTGRIDLRGQTVTSAADVARLAQVYRDPRFETFRLFYVKGDQIVAHEGLSSRLPSSANAFATPDVARGFHEYRDRMERLGADGYYMVHNHPSGNPLPSIEDLSLTSNFRRRLPGFKGHIVIDSGKYATIDANGDARIFPLESSEDPLLSPSIPHDLLGEPVPNSKALARLAKRLETPEGFVALLFLSGRIESVAWQVRAIQEVPAALFRRPEMVEYLSGRWRVFGSDFVVAYSPVKDQEILHAATTLIQRGYLADLAHGTGEPTPAGFASQLIAAGKEARMRRRLALAMGKKEASEYLASIGILGAKYLDSKSRSQPRTWEIVLPNGYVHQTIDFSLEAAEEALEETRRRYGPKVTMREVKPTFNYYDTGQPSPVGFSQQVVNAGHEARERRYRDAEVIRVAQPVYHGTPHIWEPEPGFPHGRPRLDKIGTGEGAQSYGWGWYSADAEGVANYYRPQAAPPLHRKVFIDDIPADDFYFGKATIDQPNFFAGLLHITYYADIYKDPEAGLDEAKRVAETLAATPSDYDSESSRAYTEAVSAKRIFDNHRVTVTPDIIEQRPGAIYHLDIPDEVLPKLLDWDKPLSEQPGYVKLKLKQAGFTVLTGEDLQGSAIYGAVRGKGNQSFDDKSASDYLLSIGIPGLRYLDQQSRSKGEGSYNYVIWDQKVLDKIALLERNGEKLDAIRELDQYVVAQQQPSYDTAAPVRGIERMGTLTDAQQTALQHVHGEPETWRTKLTAFQSDWKRTLIQGLFDQYAPILDYSKEGYMLARQSKGGEGTLEALLLYGKPYVDADGAYRVDYEPGQMNGFGKVLASLQGEADRFLEWVAAQRAERLKGIGLEHLYRDEDIAAIKTLNDGTMPDGSSRKAAYNTALVQLNEWNAAMVKIAADSKLIDPDVAKLYKDTPYVPFYRLQEEGVVSGFGMKAGLVNQYAWKKLKGGTQHLNDDLLANLLQNWSHLITASAKNRAAKATLEAAVQSGVAHEVPSGAPGKGLVGFRDDVTRTIPLGQEYEEGGVTKVSDGTAKVTYNAERMFRVDDPALFDAVAALHYAGLGSVAKPFIAAKRYLTTAVTVNPAFKIRNLIRDSIQAIGTAELSYNPLKNIAQGFQATTLESETRAQVLAGGGMIRFGTMLDGNNADRTRRLIEQQGVDPDAILDDAGKLTRFWRHRLLPAFEAYQELGDRGEQVNRVALYEQLRAKGMSHLEASFWARDLLDFSLSGKWEAVRILTQVVPFMNARLQGIYKLGRATRADYRRMGTTLGAVALSSIALLLAYQDDEDWKKREDWDRDNYWWFKVGDLAFRLPKPFEIGAIGTLAERGAEYLLSDEMTAGRLGERLSATVFSQLSMNPTPQLVKPLMDLYANKDAFTGRPIETLGMERLRKEDRATERTSQIARFFGSLGLPDPTQLAMGQWNTLSPVQIDALIHGYFGWVGTSATTVLDYGLRPLMNRGERPDMRLREVFLAGNFVETLPTDGSRYVTDLYDQAQEIEQAYGSWRDALKRGDLSKAKEIYEEEREKIRKYSRVEAVKRQEGVLNAQIRRIEASREIGGAEKRRRIDDLKARKHQIAQRFAMR